MMCYLKAEVGSANFYYSPLNANLLMFWSGPLRAKPLIFQACRSAKPLKYGDLKKPILMGHLE
jgi:hypothetical protein